ncbi:MAG: hypothetical protein HOO91_03820 [Bacteroidales bacterium]|nr:hypothetical protein [Bacteroidales bacterium]
MPINLNYDDPITIKRILGIIQIKYPSLGIGDYVSQADKQADGVPVFLTNGRIVIDFSTINDVGSANSLPDYGARSVSTFISNNPMTNQPTIVQSKVPRLSLWQKLFVLLGFKNNDSR